MTSQDVDLSPPKSNSQHTETSPTAVEDVAAAMATVSLQDSAAADVNKKTGEALPRPLYVYTRHELLHLSKSSIVTVPTEMPVLKDWFGYVDISTTNFLRRNTPRPVIGTSRSEARKNRTRLLQPVPEIAGEQHQRPCQYAQCMSVS